MEAKPPDTWTATASDKQASAGGVFKCNPRAGQIRSVTSSAARGMDSEHSGRKSRASGSSAVSLFGSSL
jgi:hypothetical protein